MTIIGRIVAFLIVLGIIVLVHEFGHYLSARLTRTRVEVFSFGFGKRIFGRKVGATDFRVSLIPLGGYVRLAGEEDMDPGSARPDEFLSKNRGQRFLIMVMGAVMNMVLAVMLITITHLAGIETDAYKLDPPVIGWVEPGSPAEKAGILPGDRIERIGAHDTATWKDLELAIGTNPRESLKVEFQRGQELRSTRIVIASISELELGYAGLYWNLPVIVQTLAPKYPAAQAGLREGDRIVAVNGEPVPNYFAFRALLRKSAGRPLPLHIRRGGEELDRTVVPVTEDGVGVIGFTVAIQSRKVRYGLWESFTGSLRESRRLMFLTVTSLHKMVRGRISAKQLSGPIEIAKFSQAAMQSGTSSFLMLLAFISLQLGFINLLPVPGLDGGHLLILGVETVIRRDLPARLKNALIYAGLMLLILLMVFVVGNDIAKTLPNGWSSILPFLK